MDSPGDIIWFLLGNKPAVTIGDKNFSDGICNIIRSHRPEVKRADALVCHPITGEFVFARKAILYDPHLVKKAVAKNREILKAVGFKEEILDNPDQFSKDVFSRGTSDFSEKDRSLPRQSYIALAVLYGYPITDSIILEIKRQPELYETLNPFLQENGVNISLNQILPLEGRSERVKLYGTIEAGLWFSFDVSSESKNLAEEIRRRFAISGIAEAVERRWQKYSQRDLLMERLKTVLATMANESLTVEYHPKEGR